MVKVYEDLIGKNAVSILLYEDMVNDLSSFRRSVCKILGAPPLESSKSTQMQERNTRPARFGAIGHDVARTLKQYKNRFFPDFHPKQGFAEKAIEAFEQRIVGLGGRANIVVTKYMDAEMKSFFGPGNLYLEETYGLDLRDKNYPLP